MKKEAKKMVKKESNPFAKHEKHLHEKPKAMKMAKKKSCKY
jgi:hypothetical protein